MRIFLTIFLMSAALPGQGGWLSHAHWDNGEVSHSGQVGRAHLHLHAHSHEGNSHSHDAQHEPGSPVSDPANKHDRDAVYVSAADILPVVRVAPYRLAFEASLDQVGCLTVVMGTLDGRPAGRCMWHGPPDGDSCIAGLESRCVLRC
ncbi:hypothetical protein [Planctellipticum variicoloris]|uniref:hypothetical protein n=1 Tax=Planctellipticum variicoloris TaxID=3064265 RepID=UPI003013880D|nr:hypothetical protein SH412_003736 [Planctomycetaceae bacterium SH412]